jgi:SNF2 family DNA or RNA helicase
VIKILEVIPKNKDFSFIRLIPNTTQEEFTVFAQAMERINNKDLENDIWYISNSDANKIRTIMLYNDIGKTMKLQPFSYQKEAIGVGKDNKNLLFKLPCGAGKTVIGVGLINELIADNKINGLSVIIVKATLKAQWLKEVSKFTDLKARIIKTYAQSTTKYKSKIRKKQKEMDTLLKDASKNCDSINAIEEEINELNKEADNEFTAQFNNDVNILIMNYETLADDKVKQEMHKANLSLFYIDEIDMIKEYQSQRNKNLCEFADTEYKFGATATPIRKNPQDIFGIFKFINPTLFKNISSFNNSYVTLNKFFRPSGSKNEQQLANVISPYIFSKTSSDISKELPKQVVIPISCQLTEAQYKMNEQINQELDELKEEQTAIINKLGPYKYKENEEYIKNEGNIVARQTFAQMLADSEELLQMSDSNMSKRYITGSPSSKIALCLTIIEKVINSDEKVCVFSRFLGIQDILERELKKLFPNEKVGRIRGSMTSQERDAVITEYNTGKECNILLLSDAAEAGINLSTTKYMIEFELADSAAKQTQRWGRTRRADSIHETTSVYQLIAENSYDEIAQKIVNKKQKYDESILSNL